MKEYKICDISLSEIQGYLFEILQELDRICRKYDIKYSLEGGTLLGAAKYGDFVPWDDDLDVVMLRAEYERFIETIFYACARCFAYCGGNRCFLCSG